MLEEKIMKEVSEKILAIIDTYELSVSESRMVINKTFELLENIAIIPHKRRYSRNQRRDV